MEDIKQAIKAANAGAVTVSDASRIEHLERRVGILEERLASLRVQVENHERRISALEKRSRS